jgi:hypothetical protein
MTMEGGNVALISIFTNSAEFVVRTCGADAVDYFTATGGAG